MVIIKKKKHGAEKSFGSWQKTQNNTAVKPSVTPGSEQLTN